MDFVSGLQSDRFSVVQMNGVPDWQVLDQFEISLRKLLSADARHLQLVDIKAGEVAALSSGNAPRLIAMRSDELAGPASRSTVTVLVTPDAELAAVLRKFATVAFWIDPVDDVNCQGDASAALVSCDRRATVDSPWYPAGTWPY